MLRTLLVIDIQNDYFPGGVLPLWEAESTETRIIHAIQRAQQQGDRVVLVRHVSRADAGLFATGSAGNEIRTQVLAVAPDAPVITKRFADAFQETELSTCVEGTGHLLVCGMMTQNCVAFTAMSTLAPRCDITVLSDLCTAPLESVHKIAVNALQSKINVRTSNDIW
ncbi:cysteine hydrolase family protein [Pseudomonas sp. Marseille-QA0892]